MLTRRGLLTASATAATAAAVAAGAAACTDDPPAAGSPGGSPGGAPPFDPNDWASVRAQFALDPTLANFAAFYFASHPATVRAAIDRHRAGLDANPHRLPHRARAGAGRRGVHGRRAATCGTDPNRIALTDSTTMGLGLLYTGIRLAPGDEVLTTEHDFYATHESLRPTRAARDGMTVRRVRLYDEPAQARADDIVRPARSPPSARAPASSRSPGCTPAPG